MTVSKKVSILGDFAVGKTSLVRRYVLNEFSDSYQATLGVNIYKYQTQLNHLGSETDLNLILWDVEGFESSSGVIENYVRGSAGGFIVGDATRPDVVDSLQRHAAFFQSLQPGRPLVFAFNKIDLLEEQLSAEVYQPLGEQFGAPVFQTSAATGETVKEAFDGLSARILEIGA